MTNRNQRLRNNYAEIAVQNRIWQQRYVWIVAWAACTATGHGATPQMPGRTTEVMTCVNPASDATWRITIDYARATVDSYPAHISNDTLSWHDVSDGGHYRLDRASGELTVVVASSTGGYFLHDRCHLAR